MLRQALHLFIFSLCTLVSLNAQAQALSKAALIALQIIPASAASNR